MQRLQERPLKEATLKEYLGTLRALGIADLPVEEVTLMLVNARLQRVLNSGTRRKHAINLRATLGLNLPCPRPIPKVYALPPQDLLRTALENSPYALWGLVMLYAGLRLGEACVNQPLDGLVLNVDRQRRPDGSIASAKTCGPVHIPEWLAERYAKHDFTRGTNTVYVGIRRAGKRHKLTLNPHQLRHAYATHLVRQGASPEILRRQMRHHNVSVSLGYYVQVTDADITAVVHVL